MTTRPTAVAGLFYPNNRVQLQNMVHDLLDQVEATSATRPMAIIAPHAGYIYSGIIAASAYQILNQHKTHITRALLLGPAHRVALSGLAASTHTAFATPLGDVPVDTDAVSALCQHAQVNYNDEAHAQEHSLEVHLPFLQTILPVFHLIPLVVGDIDSNTLAELLAPYWEQSDTLIIVSSDLSHYESYETAKRIDKKTTQLIEQCAFEQLQPMQACGYYPICGLLALAKQKHAHIQMIAQCNSGDTAGDKARVVGYGAYVIH